MSDWDRQPKTEDPLPLITEILYAVPQGVAGDATGDGTRHATGDEFVEIHNPTEEEINLTGWSITDRNAPDSGQFLFVFPRFRLGAGETLVVFNGLEQSIPGPSGDAQRAPRETNPRFENAWIFNAGNTSSRVGLANSADWVCLRTARGKVISVVKWGNPIEEPPTQDRLESAPRTSRASVQRSLAGLRVPFGAHPNVEGLRCSPGKPPPPPPVPASEDPVPEDG